MHPANENGYTPHGMSEHMGMMPQDLNSHAYQQPLPHVIPPSSGISVAIYHQSDVHHRIMHPSHPPPPPQPAPRCTSHQQPAAQPPRSESYGGDSHFKKTEHPTEFSNIEPHTNRLFRLEVLQQPERARMCGYGDKDRRPITPPPCIRVIIIDPVTEKEVNYSEIDFSTYNLIVDLWDKDRCAESNLCRQPPSAGVPSSTTSGFSYVPGPGNESTQMRYAPPSSVSTREMSYPQSSPMYLSDYGQQMPTGYGLPAPTYPPNGTYGPPAQHFPHLPSQRYDPSMMYVENNPSSASHSSDGAKGMMSRNLIGNVVGSAHLLTEPPPSGREGIWFVLQDLSVRLEGDYCLRFTFVNVAETDPALQQNGSKVACRKVPALASCFSSRFKVYSAKKFPGVHESTALSKAFAEQGVKIPIRKTGEDGKEGRHEVKDEDE